jgi:sugar (pentulose or hexulose) kinase
MAGREFDEISEGRIVTPTPQDEAAVLAGRVMALPSLHPGTGPFPGLRFGWSPAEPRTDGMRVAAASFYAALMGAECLALIGAEGPSVVEGPFGGNAAFARMLASATGRPVIAAGASAGTGLGAALLAGPVLAPRAKVAPVMPEGGADWMGYAGDWRAEVGQRWAARPAR